MKISPYFLSALVALPGLVMAQPEFQADGSIRSGDYRFSLRSDGAAVLSDPEGNDYEFFLPMGNYAGAAKSGWKLPNVLLKDSKVSIDAETQSTVFTGLAIPPGREPFEVSYRMSLTDEGRIRLALKHDVEEPAGKYFGADVILHVARQALAGNGIMADGESFPVAKGPVAEKGEVLWRSASAEGKEIVLNAERPDQQIVVTPLHTGYVTITDNNFASYRPPFVAVKFENKNNEVIFDVELPKVAPVTRSRHTHAGIDFWQVDKLAMPDYGASLNLVQNPGFETGFRYWRWNTLGSLSNEPKHKEYYRISGENAHSGSHSLVLRGEPGQSPTHVATFAIPVEPGKEYTLSFYARSESPDEKLAVNAQGKWVPSTFPIWKSIPITQEWKRYEFTFKAPHAVLSIGFANHNAREEGWIFVDSVQLEPGAVATEFKSKPIVAWLEGGERGRLWQPGDDPQAVLNVRGKAGEQGHARLVQTDFFGKETDLGERAFSLDKSGSAQLPLPWAAELKPGIYTYAIQVRTEAGFSGTDYDRFTVMPYLENKHTHKNLFSAHLGDRYPEWDREGEFLKRVGIGSAIVFDPQLKGYHEMLKRNGIFFFSSIFDSGHGFKEMKWEQKDGFDLSEEQLQQIEELSYQKALAYPETTHWKLNNEPAVQAYIDNPPAMKKMNAALLAARRGILRANPSAKVVGSDPANLYANAGQAFINTQLEVAGDEIIYDIAAIHPYRARPEEPDRDLETRQFLDILDRHKFKGDVWFTEGIYHNNYVIPAWGLNAHKGCTTDGYRAGAASYGMGWGERMAAAYTARSWLSALKYGDRIKMDIDWGFRINSYSDVDITPMASVFAANTLGHILGEARFQQDFSLGYEVRCYVFEDDKKRPVAVLWSHNLDRDLGKADATSLEVADLAKAFPETEQIDFMGNGSALKEQVLLSPFPVFLRGPAGSMDEFLNALSTASLANDHDGDYRKRALSVTPPGTEPYRNPEVYPVVILVPMEAEAVSTSSRP